MEHYVFEFDCNECAHSWYEHSADSDYEPACPMCGSEDTDRDLVQVVDSADRALQVVDTQGPIDWDEGWDDEDWEGESWD